jgi:hypothetical protein
MNGRLVFKMRECAHKTPKFRTKKRPRKKTLRDYRCK